MATTIFGLRFKYESETGQSLIFYERDGNELTSTDLHDVQLKMIHSNRIPHTLPLSVENLDLKTTLHYDITARRKISAFLRNHDSTMNDYYQLFLSIIKTLEDCGSYMLNQQNYILNKDFIYVGENIKDVYLTYLPITQLKRNTTVTEDIQKLLTDIAGDIQGLQGNEFKSILNYISDDSFSLSGLKKLLLDLISVRSNVHQPDTTDYDEPGYFDDLLPDDFPRKTEQSKESKQSQQKAHRDQVSQESIPQNKTLQAKLPALTSREVIFLILGAVLLLAITWKLYDMFTNAIMLVVCIVISLYIIIGAFVYWKIWRPGVKKISSSLVEETNKQQPRQQNQGPKPDQQSRNIRREAEIDNAKQFEQKQPASQNRDFKTQDPIQQYQRESFHRPRPQPTPSPTFQSESNIDMGQRVAASSFKSPNIDDHHDDTILLDDDDQMNNQTQEYLVPILIKKNEHGQEDDIPINTNHFLIGRNQHSVNYVETAIGVSRIHIEIMKIDGTTYAIKDLGSKNGTKVNGEKLVPYKVYALNEHDEIEVGRATYTFSWSNV